MVEIPRAAWVKKSPVALIHTEWTTPLGRFAGPIRTK